MPQPHFDQDFWDERYRDKQIWSGHPNAVLVAETSSLAPGSALDVGCGEGADAIWLARRGWRVTAMDISPIALQRAAEAATEAGVTGIDWQQADLSVARPPERAFDLVTAQYFLHVPNPLRDQILTALAAAVAPGGTLLVAAHDPADAQRIAAEGNGPGPAYFFSVDEVTALLTEGWQVLVGEVRPRADEHHHHHHGESGEQDRPLHSHDVVVKAVKQI